MPSFEGVIEKISYRNEVNGWTVASLRLGDSTLMPAVGTMPVLSAGEAVVFEGELIMHRDYGRQIKVSRYEVKRPNSVDQIERYLGSGIVKGVGPATAKQIVAEFGENTLTIMESEPERLLEIPGIGKKRLKMIAESFMEHNDMRGTLMFLQSYGLSPALSVRVYKAFGASTESAMRKNPYRLADEVDGVGFRTADAIAMSMGFSRESEVRLTSGIRYVLSEAVNGMGHTYLPLTLLIEQASRTLEADEDLIDTCLRRMLVEGRLSFEEHNGETAVYLPVVHYAERETAELLTQLIHSAKQRAMPPGEAEAKIAAYEKARGVSLSPEQAQAVLLAVSEGVCVITGGPGTGKTTSINCIIRLLSDYGTIELCAPTGRAAKRMSEATGKPARTIHRLLEYSGEEGRFQRDRDNPIDADAVIVDEMSMVDIFLMRALLSALKPGSRLIMVGDADQLPSVGAGNVLRDIIDSGCVGTLKLIEIFRQAERSMIIKNAHRINRGEYPIMLKHDTDFFMERRQSAEAAIESVISLVTRRLPAYLNVDPLRGIQVMSPMKRGDAGVYALNRRLQEALNPPSPDKPELFHADAVFRLYDKVMQIKNDYDLAWRREFETGAGIFNGDIGYIIAIDRHSMEMTIEFDDGRIAVYDENVLDELELAYCMSVHKSQGSEFEAVVMPLIAGPKLLMTRNLFYTAVTRAKRLVVLVGRENCVEMMVDNDHITKRYSALAERLRDMDKKEA